MISNEDLEAAVRYIITVMNDPFADHEMRFAAASEIVNLAFMSGLLGAEEDPE